MKINKKLFDVNCLQGLPRIIFDEEEGIIIIRRKKDGGWASEPTIIVEFGKPTELEAMLLNIINDKDARSWAASSVKRSDAQWENYLLFLENVEISWDKFSRFDFLENAGISDYDQLKELCWDNYIYNRYDKDWKSLPESDFQL